MPTHETKHVFRWDLDKTYLRTEFDTVGDLVRSAFESATDKQAYPGATALLRSLRAGDGHRICIISGSPTQMRKVLAAKLALDGIEYDEFVLKNNLRNLRRLRFRALRSQIPYKLPVLLASRAGLNRVAPETLFGDDAEADALVYSLYSDLLGNRVDSYELEQILKAARAYPDQIEQTLALLRQVNRTDSVQRILIHLDRRSATARFTQFGKRLVPIYNYFQAALLLHADGLLTTQQVLFVARSMLNSEEYEISTLANSLQDLLLRDRVSLQSAQALIESLETIEPRDNKSGRLLHPALRARTTQLGDAVERDWPYFQPKLDYLSLVDTEFQRRRG